MNFHHNPAIPEIPKRLRVLDALKRQLPVIPKAFAYDRTQDNKAIPWSCYPCGGTHKINLVVESEKYCLLQFLGDKVGRSIGMMYTQIRKNTESKLMGELKQLNCSTIICEFPAQMYGNWCIEELDENRFRYITQIHVECE